MWWGRGGGGMEVQACLRSSCYAIAFSAISRPVTFPAPTVDCCMKQSEPFCFPTFPRALDLIVHGRLLAPVAYGAP